MAEKSKRKAAPTTAKDQPPKKSRTDDLLSQTGNPLGTESTASNDHEAGAGENTSNGEQHQEDNSPRSRLAAVLSVDPNELQEYDERTAGRILTFVTYEKNDTNTFAIDKLPAKVEWGQNRPFDDKAATLCKPLTNEPFTIWIVGKISRMWFYNNDGTPATQVSINVVPLSKGTSTAARRTVAQLSSPRLESALDGWGDVRATKFQTGRSVGSAKGEVKEFTDVYDATQTFSAKGKMTSLATSNLNIRDLVLLEVQVGRYRLKEGGSSSESTANQNKVRPGWEKWRAQFELLSIALIHKSQFFGSDDKATEVEI